MEGTTNFGKLPEEFDKNYFKQFLDSEIDHFRKEIYRPGWTKWAIYGSLAYLLWTFLNLIEKNSFVFSNIALIIVSVTICVQVVFFLKLLLVEKSGNFHQTKYNYSNEIFSSLRSIALTYISLFAIILMLTFNLPPKFSNIALYGLRTVIVLELLVFLFLLSISFFRFPLKPKKEPKKGEKIFEVTSLIIIAILSYYLVYFTVNFISNLTLVDFKFSAIIIAVSILVVLMNSNSKNNSLMKRLIGIRRQLALSEISYQEAYRLSKVTLIGLSAGNLLSSKIDRFIEINDKILSEINFLLEEKDETKQKLNNQKDSQEYLQSLSEPISLSINKIKSLFKESRQVINDIRYNIRVMLILGSKNDEEFNQVIEVMENSQKKLSEKVDSLDPIFSEFFNTLK